MAERIGGGLQSRTRGFDPRPGVSTPPIQTGRIVAGMLARLLDRIDHATRPAQYLAALLVGIALDEIAQTRLRVRRGRAPRA